MKVFTFIEWLESKQWDIYSYQSATKNERKALDYHYDIYRIRNSK